MVASAAGSLEFPGLPMDHLLEEQPLFMAPNQWHRIVVKLGPDAAVVARGVRLRFNAGSVGAEAAQAGVEFKRKTASGFENYTPDEMLEGSDLYNTLTGPDGLVLFAKLPPSVDQLHRLSLDLLPNGETLEPMEIRKLAMVPVGVDDNLFATGVDDVSLTAQATDIGYQKKFWIMAPAGNDPSGNRCSNDTVIKLPVEPDSQLRMDCTHAACEYRHPVSSTAAAPPVPIGHGLASAVRRLGTGAESGDHTPIYKLGDAQTQVDLPIAVKTMKRRTVKVHVYRIAKKFGTAHPRPPDPATVPTETELENYLEPISAYQLNTWFEVTLEDDIPAAEFGVTFHYDITGQGHSDDQEAAINAFGGLDGDADLHVFLIGTNGYLGETGAVGVTSPPKATCWIVGRPVGNYDSKQDVLETIGHEIGHVFIGAGHPDEVDPVDRDVAPLDGTDHNKRLMCKNPAAGSRLVVKREWDWAEKWLKENPDARYRREHNIDSKTPIGNY